RNRIARELHDVVAHHLSMIAIRAAPAALPTPGIAADGQEQLAAIGGTARDALTEMRRLLGVLRVDVDEAAALAPQPGLDRIGELVEAARAAGTPVRLTLSGTPVPLPVGVDLSAYRIVQEALTNARQHAPGAAVEVEVAYTDDMLRLRIRDDGPGSTQANPSGHGLHGMRERAALAGGTLPARPADAGGFVGGVRPPGGEPATCPAPGHRSGCSSPTTRRSSAPGSARYWAPSPTSRSSAAPRAGRRRVGCAARYTPTSYSWTSGCRLWTVSRRPAGSPPERTRGPGRAC